jgi:hypothetical protein
MTVYDVVRQIEHSFVLRTEKEIINCAWRLVQVELVSKCDVYKGWFSVANY